MICTTKWIDPRLVWIYTHARIAPWRKMHKQQYFFMWYLVSNKVKWSMCSHFANVTWLMRVKAIEQKNAELLKKKKKKLFFVFGACRFHLNWLSVGASISPWKPIQIKCMSCLYVSTKVSWSFEYSGYLRKILIRACLFKVLFSHSTTTEEEIRIQQKAVD